MPGKSKRKKLRYATSKQSNVGQTRSAAQPTIADTQILSKPAPTSVKSPPSASKAAAAQYSPDLLKHVGTELKISVALSVFILVVIVGLFFILH